MKKWLALAGVLVVCHADVAMAASHSPSLWQRILSAFRPAPTSHQHGMTHGHEVAVTPKQTDTGGSAEAIQTPAAAQVQIAQPVQLQQPALASTPAPAVQPVQAPQLAALGPPIPLRRPTEAPEAAQGLQPNSGGESVGQTRDPAQSQAESTAKPAKAVKKAARAKAAPVEVAVLGSPNLKAVLPADAAPPPEPTRPADSHHATPSRQEPDSACNGGHRVISAYYWEGHHTASGQPFNAYGMTAAHRTLPFGTHLNVTNPRTGKSVTVLINDRGPFVHGVSLDLSLGAAQAIGLQGTGSVCIL
jgi:rare lipoprotein A